MLGTRVWMFVWRASCSDPLPTPDEKGVFIFSVQVDLALEWIFKARR
jgi:hypothetical protein